MPATAVTTFTDHWIEAWEPIVFASRSRRMRGYRCDPWQFSRTPDRTDCRSSGMTSRGRWDGGDWQINVPPQDSLGRYDFGTPFTLGILDEAQVGRRLAELAWRSEQLPASAVSQRRLAVDWQRALGAFGFNRVQGVSLGWGLVWQTGAPFLAVHPAARLSAGDRRLTGELALRREAPEGSLVLSVGHGVAGVEPWARTGSAGSGLKALFTGHDDADYMLVTGARLDFEPRGRSGGLTVSLGVERQTSLVTVVGSSLHDAFFGDGQLGANPPVRDGDYARLEVRQQLHRGRVTAELGAEGLATDALAAGRAWGTVRAAWRAARLPARVKAGVGARLGQPVPQLDFRLGGPATVRGFSYGVRTARRFWSVQADLELSRDPWVAPVIFADVAGGLDGSAASSEANPMAGAGAGLLLLSGLLRLDCAKGLRPTAAVRCDAQVTLPRAEP
jgi:hypothetical protein